MWSLWSRNKWWVLLPCPLFLTSSFCVTSWKTKIHQSLISLLNTTPATWDRHRLYSSLCSFSSGGWSELSAAGDLWDWEQIQQPRIKGKHQTARECFSLRVSVTASDVTWQFGKKWITDLEIVPPFISRLQTMRSATTALSVWCVCRMCGTHSSCRADTCVSATPAQTLCATRPTAAPSADCVSSHQWWTLQSIFVLFLVKKRKDQINLRHLLCLCLCEYIVYAFVCRDYLPT